jgi:hypothetical protein
MRPGVRYFCPTGVDRPAHRPDLLGGVEVVAGHGPDVAAGGPGGGLVLGGSYEAGETGWQRTEAGWWVNLGTALPQHLWRTQTNPRIARWATVEGALPEHRWRVPILLVPAPSDGGGAPTAYLSALERVWKGGEGWVDDAELARLTDDLHAVAHGIALHGLDHEWPAITDLVLRLLVEGQRISRFELAAGGWLSERMLLRTIIAAADAPVPEAVA